MQLYFGLAPASQLQFARPRVPQRFVKDDSRWAGFRPKLAKWLCLCDNYPYRMSFLVLVITDRVQKALVNRLCFDHPSRSDKYELVHYCKGAGDKASTSAPAEAEEPHAGLELADDMPIVEAYFQHVERYIYSHPKARKMLSLDGDPVRGRRATHPPPVLAGFLSLHLMTVWSTCAGDAYRAAHAAGGKSSRGRG